MNSIEEYGIIPELKSFQIFSSYDSEQLKTLFHNGKVIVSKHREDLFSCGDKADFFYVVLSGAFKLSKITPGGENSIIHFSPPGDVIAAFIMSQPQPIYPLSAIAMGPSRAIKIPRNNYLENWREMPDLIFKIQNLLSSRMAALQNQKALSKAPLQSKVASLLVQLVDPNLLKDKEDAQIPIPLTRKEIADCVGSTVESIIRIMSDWSKKGVITTSDQQITILKKSQLLELTSKDF